MLVARRPPTSRNVSSLRRIHAYTDTSYLKSKNHTLSCSPQHSPHKRLEYFRLDTSRSFHTSSPCLGIPSVSANGPIQSPQYLAAVELINSRLATKYPNGRAVYSPEKNPLACPSLPVPEAIGTRFNLSSTKGRCSLIDPEAARAFVRGALGLGEDQSQGSEKEGRVIIEAFPAADRPWRSDEGTTGTTKIRGQESYCPRRGTQVFTRSQEYYDDRVHVLSQSGFIWETYDTVKDLGLLDDIAVEDWKAGPHSSLSFIGHLPLGPVGEQLIAQLFRAIPERSWLFKYGRMRMSWILAQRMLEVCQRDPIQIHKCLTYSLKRISSPPQRAARCKLTIVSEATANIAPAVPHEVLEGYDQHFWPQSESAVGGKKKTPRIGQPFVAINVDPQAEGSILSRDEARQLNVQQAVTSATDRAQGLVSDTTSSNPLAESSASKAQVTQAGTTQPGLRVTLDKWDYVLRQLFILKSTPLEKAIQYVITPVDPASFVHLKSRNLGPGAAILLSKLTGPEVPESQKVNTKQPINAMSLRDFARVVEEFHKWPFAPDVSTLLIPVLDSSHCVNYRSCSLPTKARKKETKISR
ncbi:RrnaAD domain-containing protein [Rhizoctonia solani AG-1 IA]|uniref:RrnaAD domain-containing protein n=1 Tax=Thanatephorus cucumeris (strain AG1-IA) TaxID=983506 RepID=L8WVW9_THACA|nr:RrnaAD domain-containing protein [Rhizoctonia solani AG-1 IA]